MGCPFCYGWRLQQSYDRDDFMEKVAKRRVVLIKSAEDAVPAREGFIYTQLVDEDVIAEVEKIAVNGDITYNTVGLWKEKRMLLWYLEPVV